MLKKILAASAAAVVMCGSAAAADFKIGLVSPAKILAESAPAVAAQEKLKTYFKSVKTSSIATSATSAPAPRSSKRTAP